MSDFDYDLFVIGAGSGGVRAARIAAGHGARVAICEESRVGGTCVIRGCVPKKLLSYAAHFAEDFEDAAGFGWTVDTPSFSWPDLRRALHAHNLPHARELPTRAIPPEEGRMLLFPSYMYHRTIPFESETRRISIALDAVPAR